MNFLAQSQPEPSWLVPTIIGAAFVLILGVLTGILLFVRWYCRRAERALTVCLSELPSQEQPQPGEQRFEFPVYLGLLGGGVQRTYRFWLSPEQAPAVLARLHRFNCRWGWLMLGPLAPILSYTSLRRSLRTAPPPSTTRAA